MLSLQNKQSLVKNPFTDTNDTVDYLNRELKLNFHHNQQQAIITALGNPDKWLKDRKKHMEDMVIDLGIKYNQYVEDYYKLNLPLDQCIFYANKKIRIDHKYSLDKLEMQHPGTATLFQSAVLKNQYNSSILEQLVDGPVMINKAEYKKKRKAKKAAKKQ